MFPLVTALLYFYSFCFDAGLLTYFGVPASQVRIGLELLGNAAASLWPSLLFGFFSLPLNFYYWPATQVGFYSIYLGFLIVLITAQVALQVAVITELPLLAALPIFVGIFWAYIGSVYLRRRGVILNRSGRPPQVYDAWSEFHDGTIAEYFVKKRGFDPLLLILIFFILAPGTFLFCGWTEGKQLGKPDSFLNDGQLLGIVRIYADRIISVPLSSDGEVIAGSYVVIPALDVAGVVSFTTRFERNNSSSSQNNH